MNPSERNDWLRRLFEKAADSSPAAAGPHVVEDFELLTCWAQGQIAADEQTRFVAHLADCAPCCRELTQMLRSGVLVLPEPVDAADVKPRPQILPMRRSRRPWFIGAAAAAAAILVATLLYFPRPPSLEYELASLAKELDTGKAKAVLEKLERLSPKKLDPGAEEQWNKLWERAGYLAARAELGRGRFEATAAILQRLTARGAESARLENLQFQAERRIAAEYTLAQAGALTSYGYELDGFAPAKGLPTLDLAAERRDRAGQQAVNRHPRDAGLRVNYGQFLLTLARYDEARQQFSTALQLERGMALAHLGLGLVAFESEQFAEALGQFQAAIKSDSDNAAAHVNAAMCAEQLGQRQQGVDHWDRAAALTTDAELKERIAAHRARFNK